MIDRAQTELVEALETLKHQIQNQSNPSLVTSPHEVAQLVIDQQYANPMSAAALDHEEARLPLQQMLKTAQKRLLVGVQQIFAHHQAELAPDLLESAARNCIAITKALVELEAGVLKKPPADLKERTVKASMGI